MGRIRQGRLFNPVGMYTGNPDAMDIEKWLSDQSRGPIVHHGSSESSLPAHDDPDRSHDTGDEYGWINANSNAGAWSTDLEDDIAEGRRRAAFGYATGMHFGSKVAAYDRALQSGHEEQRTFLHSARIPTEAVASGKFNDRTANFNPAVDDLVHGDQAIPYSNQVEDAGSISYRTKPEVVRTWGEDVMDAADRGRAVHPSVEAAARSGYNPVHRVGWDRERDVAHWDDNEASYRAHGMHNPEKQQRLWSHEVIESVPGKDDALASVHQSASDAASAASARNADNPQGSATQGRWSRVVSADVSHRSELLRRMGKTADSLPQEDFYHGKSLDYHRHSNLNPQLFRTGLRE